MTLGVGAALILVLLPISLASESLDLARRVAPILLVGVAAFLFFTRRTGLALAAFMVYIGTADGVLRLTTGSDLVTLGRDILLGAIAGGVLVRAVTNRTTISRPPLLGLILAYIACCLVQVFNPEGSSIVRSLGALRPHLLFIPLFFLGFAMMRSKRHLRVYLVLLLVIGAANGIANFVQFNLTPEQLAGWGPGYAERIEGSGSLAGRTFSDSQGVKRVRPFGLGGDFGFGGFAALLALPAALAFVGQWTRYRRRALLTLPLLGLLVLGVLTSQARSAVIGTVLAAAAFILLAGFTRRGLSVIVGTAVAAVVALTLISNVTQSVDQGSFSRYDSIAPSQFLNTAYDYRVDTWRVIPTYMKDLPLGAGLGSVGPGASFRTQQIQRTDLNGESEVTFLIIELGIPGLILLSALLAMFCVHAGRAVRRARDAETRVLLAAVSAPLFAMVVFWFAGITTAGPPLGPVFWFVGGVVTWWATSRDGDDVRRSRFA